MYRKLQGSRSSSKRKGTNNFWLGVDALIGVPIVLGVIVGLVYLFGWMAMDSNELFKGGNVDDYLVSSFFPKDKNAPFNRLKQTLSGFSSYRLIALKELCAKNGDECVHFASFKDGKISFSAVEFSSSKDEQELNCPDPEVADNESACNARSSKLLTAISKLETGLDVKEKEVSATYEEFMKRTHLTSDRSPFTGSYDEEIELTSVTHNILITPGKFVHDDIQCFEGKPASSECIESVLAVADRIQL